MPTAPASALRRVRPRSSSRPRTARASCTSRPRSARTTCKLGQKHDLPRRARRRRGRPLRRGGDAGRGQVRQGRRPDDHRSSCRSAACCSARRSTMHSYPFCWRCDTPLLYYARNAWYIRTTRYRDQHGRAQRDDQVGARRTSARAASATGSRTTSTGRSRASATGARRCPSGAGDVRLRASASARVEELEKRAGRKLRDLDLHRPVRRRASPSTAQGCGDVSARARGHRLLVRLRRDAVRAVALPVRERERVRAALPRRLHLRGDRPDARLVLHAARDRDDGRGRASYATSLLPEHILDERGQEDEQVAGQRRSTRTT